MTGENKTRIFRRADAQGLMECGAMEIAASTPEQRAGVAKMVEAGYLDGGQVKVLVNLPGFSLTHAWLKKDYPLLLHSHDSDCLYYIVAGSLIMGSETLESGDSFFVPGGSAYTYVPGPAGVEVLEFRHATHFDFVNLTKNTRFYEKAVETIGANRDGWREAKRPSQAG